VPNLPSVQLNEICGINPRVEKGLNGEKDCSFIPMKYVDDSFGIIRNQEERKMATVQKGYTSFREGDVLFAKITPCMENGKCAIAKNLVNQIGFGSTEFHVVRPGESVIAEWVFFYLRQERVRQDLERKMTGSAGQKRVPSAALQELEIPLPPLEEQKRTVAIARKCDRLRRTRRFTQQLSDTYLQSAFLEIFGEYLDDFPSTSLGEVVTITGGGTPSRDVPEYFEGKSPGSPPKI